MVIHSRASSLRPQRRVLAERSLPFSPRIVWDAVVDADLADGWLAHLIIEPVSRGRFAVVWPTEEPHSADWYGVIERIVTAERLVARFAPHTIISFELRGRSAQEGGGSVFSVLHESFFTADEADSVAGFWANRLDLLDSLLRGHPVDWRHEERLH